MADMESGESESKGVSIWVVVAVVVAALVLISLPLWYVINSLVSPETISTAPPPVVVSSLDTGTTVAEAATTTSEPATTTTAPPQSVENPFVGWWRATDADGSQLDLRIDAEGTFSYWDSAAGGRCLNGDVRSPVTWVGRAAFELSATPTLTASGSAVCQFYGIGHQTPFSLEFDFYYHSDTDTLEFAPDGVVYVRSPSVPGAPTDGSNPFVGSWEATDGDLTHVEMTVLADGSWVSTDTRSAGCEAKGFTYGTWSGEGSGTFELSGTRSFDVTLTTYCHPVGEEKVIHSPEVNFVFSYQEGTDTLDLENGPTYTRLP